MTDNIEPWMIDAMKSLHCAEYYTDAMAERDARHVAAHAPKQEPSVPVSKLKEFERELQWGRSIKRLRRLFTDIIHEAEQEKQP